jgi:hypothetical protein
LALAAALSLQAGAFAANQTHADSDKANGGVMAVRDATGSPGKTATVSIRADGKVKKLAGIMMVLEFDPSLKVAKDDVVAGSLLHNPLQAVNLSQPGKITLGLVATKDYQGPGELVRLAFHLPKGVSPGKSYPIRVTKIETNDQNSNKTTVKSQDGSIQVAKSGKKDKKELKKEKSGGKDPK